jgi:hypothetical protein
MAEALGGALFLGLMYLLSAIAIRSRGVSKGQAGVFGFIGAIVVLLATLIAYDYYETRQIKEAVKAEATKKKDWLKQLCDERKSKGEIPGAGC